MGVIQGGALSNTVIADPDLLWPVPDHWTLEEAASVPLSYLHAYYCLVSISQVSVIIFIILVIIRTLYGIFLTDIMITILLFHLQRIKCQLKSGRTILVHGGAGALGQAIISMCLAIDCEVFTTVSDIQKKEFLLTMFPKLKGKKNE